jgi:hypothetical protein
MARSVSGGARLDAELRNVRVAGVPDLLDRFVEFRDALEGLRRF